jgi:hypothetical protein
MKVSPVRLEPPRKAFERALRRRPGVENLLNGY